MLKGFKTFLTRGNVIDLAIAVIIGTAFTAVITSITTGLLQPVISVFGGHSVNGLGFHLIADKPATYVALGSIITAIVNFLTVAAVLYFGMTVPMKAMIRRNAQPTAATPSEIELLTEIRDLLRARAPSDHPEPGLRGSAGAMTDGAGL